MKKILLSTILVLLTAVTTYADVEPPTIYGAPENVTVTFEYYGEDFRFNIGYNASEEVRDLVKSIEEECYSGYSSFGVSVRGDYRIDDDSWRSEKSDYENWVDLDQGAAFSHINGHWDSAYGLASYRFEDIFTGGNLPGGESYFDDHSMDFRLKFKINYFDENSGAQHEYYSDWSDIVTYSNNQEVYNPEELINHAPTLISAELKERNDGTPFIDFRANEAHEDIKLLNSISNGRIMTNVWIKVGNGNWMDASTYSVFAEQFDIEAGEYFTSSRETNFEVKFRYSFDNAYYPQGGKSGNIHSPFSNVISKGMPKYEGASSWAKNELDRANKLGLITPRIKSNMSGNVTREEFAEIAVKLYEAYKGNIPVVGNAYFSDTTNPEILKAANLGLVKGVGNDKYNPDALVTREQMATILQRVLVVLEPNEDFSVSGVSSFADDDKIESWAHLGVYYCTKTGIVTGIGDNMFDPDGNATREQAVIVCLRAYEYFK